MMKDVSGIADGFRFFEFLWHVLTRLHYMFGSVWPEAGAGNG